jgi:hypothetical protein
MGFLAGGTLDQNAQAFNPGAGREKGYFPDELQTVENYQTELKKSEPFTHESFYSSLKQSNTSEEEYQIYLKESEGMNRLSYLLHYNERDTQIMLPIIDGLTNLFWENNIDMLHNLSLSSCSSQAKYALAYFPSGASNEKHPQGESTTNSTQKSPSHCSITPPAGGWVPTFLWRIHIEMNWIWPFTALVALHREKTALYLVGKRPFRGRSEPSPMNWIRKCEAPFFTSSNCGSDALPRFSLCFLT